MTQKELQQKGMLYQLDAELLQAHHKAMRIMQLFNNTSGSDSKRKTELVQDLFGSVGDNIGIQAPFYCDYGYNIHVGKNFACNYDCVFLDCGKITIGDNVMIGPKVALYAVGHPIDPVVRSYGHDYPVPITIGSNVWIGGSSVICPGVTIGDNVVIGAGSVVTKDIPANVVAAGNPCRVLRSVTQEDAVYWNQQLQLSQKLSEE